MNYRSPLEGYYEVQESYSGYGSARYSPYGAQPQGSVPRNSWQRQRAPQESAGSQSYGSDLSEPSTSEHRPKYSDQFKRPSYPKELSDLMGALECRLCAVEVPSPIVAKMHYSGKQHSKKVQRFLLEYSLKTGRPMPEEPTTTLQYQTTGLSNYCELCDVRLISESDKMLHYTGAKHRKNAQDPSNAKKKKKAYETIDYTSPSASARFGIGDSFSNKPLAVEASDEGKNNKTLEEYVCEMCNVKAVSQEQLNSHLSGKKHKDKLEKKNSLVPKAVNPTMSILASIVRDPPCETVDYSMHRTPSERPFKCTLCEVSLKTPKLFKLHLAGKRHLKTVAKVETQLVHGDECEICELKFTSIDHYKSHIKGKKHEKKYNQIYNSSTVVKEEKVSVVCQSCPYVGSLENHTCDYSLAMNKVMDVKNEFVCRPCHNMVFDSEEQLNEHKNSRRHVHCILNQENGDKVTEEYEHFYCFLCKKQYYNTKQYTEHLFEQTHMALSSESLNIECKTDFYHCSVCDILMDSKAKDEHLLDKKHLKLALQKDTMRILSALANEEIDTTSFYCKNCDVTFTTFINYSTHVLGKEHMKKMISNQQSTLSGWKLNYT